jgi:hypothetical protein
MNKETKSFVVGCMKFFGRKSGQGVAEFAKEIKDLTIADRTELAPLLSKELGIVITTE